MKKILFICLLLLVACDSPEYELSVFTNDYKDTLYVVSERRVYDMTDRYFYYKIYQTHDKDSAWTFYKGRIEEYEEMRKQEYK